ncbi:MAG: LysR family transcriptional regulator [Chloroflexota bacterium]
MVDFEWYRSFVAVYQIGTVSAAAKQRGMTQPAISQHIAALEHALNTALFQRAPRQMIPTADGLRLYTQVVGAVEQLEQFSNEKVFKHNQPVLLRIGVPREYFYAEGIPSLATDIQKSYQLQFFLGQTVDLLRRLEANELDMMIATQRISRRTVHYLPLHTEQFVLVGPMELAAPTQTKLSQFIEWLEQQAWIAYAPDLPIIRRYWQDVFSRRPNITPLLIVPDLLMILRAVTLGIGISVLPEYLCKEAFENNQVHSLGQPEHNPSNQLYLACLRDRLHFSEIQWFYRVMRTRGATDEDKSDAL